MSAKLRPPTIPESTPTQGLPEELVTSTAANAPLSMNPSRVRLTMPERSATTPPLAANRYGMAMRTICVRNEIGFMPQMVGKAESAGEASRVAPTAGAPQHTRDFRNRHGDGDDDDALQHIHHLLWHEGVNRQTTLR